MDMLLTEVEISGVDLGKELAVTSRIYFTHLFMAGLPKESVTI